MQQGQFRHAFRVGKPVSQRHDDRKNHRGSANNCRADQHGFRRCFECVARSVIFLQQMLGAIEVDVEVEILLDLRFNIRNVLNQRQFINGLRIVGDRAIRIDCDRHRSHAQKAERHQTKREHRPAPASERYRDPWC